MSSIYTDQHLIDLREHPHLLGHLAGKTRLSQLHSEWILYIWDTDQDRCLQAHRDSYKTTAIMAIGTMWWLLFNPDDRIALIRKKYSDAAEVVHMIKQLMKLPEIRELFKFAHKVYPEFKIQREGKLEFVFKKTSTPEGSINALGIDTGITGKHYDKIICDDFVTLKDRISKAERERTVSTIREIRTNIIETGKAVGFIGTPWHKNDAWEILPTPITFDVYDCKILTEEQIEEKRSKTTPSLFAANYLLKHTTAEGKLFSDPIYGKWVYSIRKVKAHIDAAFDGVDTCGLTFMAEIPSKPGKIQGFGKCYPGNVKDWLDVIEAEYRKRRCDEIWVESNTDKGYTASLLSARGMNVQEYHEPMNKHIKITTHLYDRYKDIEWDNSTDDEYMEQVIDYELGAEPDDCCFVAGTKVMTRTGNKNIENIKIGDCVLTPFGFKKVINNFIREKEVITNIGLTGTHNHKVYNKKENKFVSLDSLTSLVSCSKLSFKEIIKWKIKQILFLTEKHIQERANIIFVNAQMQREKKKNNYIVLFGNFIIKKKFPKALLFIIKILIHIITIYGIWNYLHIRNMINYIKTYLIKIKNIQKKEKKILIKQELKQINGMVVKKEKSGIKNMHLNHLKKHGILEKIVYVCNVMKHTLQNMFIKNTVQKNVEIGIEQRHFLKKESVLYVDKNLLLSVGQNNYTVQENADVNHIKEKQKVYNITIDQIGVYYANNILVSNCDSAASLVQHCFSISNKYEDALWEK